jgi:hypothetical protein
MQARLPVLKDPWGGHQLSLVRVLDQPFEADNLTNLIPNPGNKTNLSLALRGLLSSSNHHP